MVQVGEFIIMPMAEKGKVWIRLADGEGGEFKEAALAQVVEKFFTENL